MTDPRPKITVETFVAAPPDAVWRAYTTPEDIMQWNFASPDWHCPTAAVDLREGGRFCFRMEAKDSSMGFDFEGTYTHITPQSRLDYAFGDRTASVIFTPEPGGTRLRLRFDAETDHPADQQRAGWTAILDNFARHVTNK